MTDRETTDLRKRIRAMWEQKLDTIDMARALQIPQFEVEAQLHIVLDRRRHIVSSLRTA